MRSTALLALLAACSAKDPADSGDLPPINSGDDDSAACEGAAPEARALSLGNGGVQTFDDGDHPTLEVTVDGADADGNLDRVTLEVWWERADDGEVDTSGEADVRHTFTVRDTPCEVFDAPLGLRIQVGEALAYNTLYDVAARFTDSSGEASGVVTATGSTPRATGEDGDGTGE